MRWFNFNQYPHKNPKKHKMDSRLFSLINYTTNFNSCHFSFLKHQRLITIWIRCITHIMVLGSYYQHFFFLIFHLEPNVTNREWTHHHRKHATLVDMVGHFHHTQQSAQLALLVFVYYSFNSICKQLLQTGHSLHSPSILWCGGDNANNPFSPKIYIYIYITRALDQYEKHNGFKDRMDRTRPMWMEIDRMD